MYLQIMDTVQNIDIKNSVLAPFILTRKWLPGKAFLFLTVPSISEVITISTGISRKTKCNSTKGQKGIQ